MKQILQNLNTGETRLQEVPAPATPSGGLLIRSSRTLVSAGTERMLVEFGKGNLVQKARQQPDKVRQVVDKVRTDGLLPTLETVRNKLDTPLPLGYCNVGTVIDSRTPRFSVGDRVASTGKHAEIVSVPQNLCAGIPDSVDDESAAFVVIGAIALQGIRLIKPTLGETVVVTGLGLVGLVAVQLLRAHGCRVLGIDFDSRKTELARRFGAETVNLSAGQDPIAIADAYSRGRGVDAVLLAASTKSNDPIHQAATMCRKRGRIVLVGVVGMELSRADFYEKELSFQVSCSYGPGRYDPEYEDKSRDYPFGFVRWTAQRNFEAVLDMMADGRLVVGDLVSHRFDLDRAVDAYDAIRGSEALGVVINYDSGDGAAAADVPQRVTRLAEPAGREPADAVIGFLGAGNYASAVLVPAFAKTSARLKSIASATGVSSVHVGSKHGIELATTDTQALLEDPEINSVVITTRHSSHAKQVRAALELGKHVFVEKPLAINRDELLELTEFYDGLDDKPLLMVGFNRRYSPLVQTMRSLLAAAAQPKSMVMTVNAGSIPADHWTQDREVGGGRIIGEACHFIDLLRFLADADIERVDAVAMDSECRDSVMIQLRFADGSAGSVAYLANGSKSFPKERLEVFCGGGILQLDNFRLLTGFGWRGFRKQRLGRQDKGQSRCAAAFVDAVSTGNAQQLIPFNELAEVSAACLDIEDQLHGRR